MHSQNREAEIVLKYFNGKTGRILDIGANDGITFSNSYDLIQSGWSAFLLEPGSIFESLSNLHLNNEGVWTCKIGIGGKSETVRFYESGAHVRNGNDYGLVSSTDYNETLKWRKAGVSFMETKIELLTFEDFKEEYGVDRFDFITIDCEGSDWIVLQQIDLKEVGCQCLCIEWNSDKESERLFAEYCGQYGLREIHRNAENLIFAL